MTVLLDTNILIDHLNDVAAATAILRTYGSARISIITRIELLSGPPRQTSDVRRLIAGFEVLPLEDRVADTAAVFRREFRLKLPDAVILATSAVHAIPLLTRNTKDFEGRDGVVIPYRL